MSVDATVGPIYLQTNYVQVTQILIRSRSGNGWQKSLSASFDPVAKTNNAASDDKLH